MDLALLTRLGFEAQPWTLPTFVVGSVVLVAFGVWRRRRHSRWLGGLLWAEAVLGYVAVTMTPTLGFGPETFDWSRSPIYWQGWGVPFASLVSTSAETVVNSWILFPAGALCAAVRPARRVAAGVVVIMLPLITRRGNRRTTPLAREVGVMPDAAEPRAPR